MPTVSEQLAGLQHQRDRVQGERDAVSSTIDDTRKKLHATEQEFQKLTARAAELGARVDATRRLEADVDSANGLLTEGRESGAAEANTARAELEAIRLRVETELPEEKRKTLSAKLDEIDQAIAAAKESAIRSAHELAAAESAVLAAQQDVADAEAAQRDSQARLHALKRGLDQSRARVAGERTAAKAAASAGRPAGAFAKLRDLETAVADLERLAKPDDQDALIHELPTVWQVVLSKAQALSDAFSAVEPLRQRAAAAQKQCDLLVTNREREIDKVLTEPPAEPSLPPDPSPQDGGLQLPPSDTGEPIEPADTDAPTEPGDWPTPQ